jgi:deoxyribodipyrimidine photolyase-related protein
MNPGPHVRLVLPHQLFELHFQVDVGTVFVLIEHDLLFRQYSFHSHKLVLHRASMVHFASRLRARGYEVEVLGSDAAHSSHDQLARFVRQRRPGRVTWFDVVDDWLERDLIAGLADGGYEVQTRDVLETPNFLTDRTQIDDWFAQNPSRMQDFYIWQRRRLSILLENNEPVGGRWSFDTENRKKLPRGYVPATVGRFAHHPVLQREGTFDFDALWDDPSDAEHAAEKVTSAEVERAIAWVRTEFPNAPGDPHLFAWPTSHAEAQTHLAEFVRERLHDFGPYEDAISTKHPFINHGLLTAALNIGLLDPRQIVQAVLDGADHTTPLASLEGFIRQIIGWREYMRATYRTSGRQMRTSNRLGNQRALGSGWWDATTGLAPVDLVISRVLATGYAHHIERLMVLGNAMSLLRIHPDAVYEWFMEMFIDAYDWVMVPNVYAMSQFAAGDQITTKPYVSGSNYLRTMSDIPAGPWAPRWDGLYWTFIADHRAILETNSRMRMIVSHLDHLDPATVDRHRSQASEILGSAHNTPLLSKAPDGHQERAIGSTHV